MRPKLPTGTVTFLFTDVAGSTRLLREHGAAYAELLGEHRRILRDAFTQHEGVEVDTQGDAFFVAFARASGAVGAAALARAALAGGPIEVRMGIHTGEPIVTDEGYVGLDVHRAARIAAAAHGGQVVLSGTTQRLLDGDHGLLDLGEHRLKDLAEPERLYQLGEGEFPPLKTLDATNLPIAASPLLGRERELDELVAMLSDGSRLVTITGPGGTGKTRFALQVAAELVGRFADGVFWVPLAGLADPDVVPAEIARTIGAREDLAGSLRGKELLLLVDNFEHLLDAAPSVAELLSGASGIRVLATSRSPLRISGEVEYPLEPLPPTDAVALFAERSRTVGRILEPDAAVGAICRRLDGLPLAIELAAARMRLLTPETLLGRLDSALPLLTGGARDAPERQRTLEATIAWSYDLLDDQSKLLFARLSVFAGSFPIELAEAVCEAGVDTLTSLVDASLLKPIGGDRFLLLETIRQYAVDRLVESGSADDLRRRHAGAFSAIAEEGYDQRFQAEAEWSDRLERDHDDLRAALDWLSEHHPEGELRLASALGWFWLSHSHLSEGRRRLTDALEASPLEGRLRARALTAAGVLTAWQGDVDVGRAELAEALDLWSTVGDEGELASALDALGWMLVYAPGDNQGALDAFERSLEIRRALADPAGERRAVSGVCQVLVAMGDVERAEALSRELLEMAAGDARAEHFAFHFLADCALIEGDCVLAEERYRESLLAALPLGDVLETSFEVQGIAMAAAGRGDLLRGVRLAAAVEALWESLGTTITVPFWNALLDRYIGAARAALGADAARYWSEGRELAFEDAVELALVAATREPGSTS